MQFRLVAATDLAAKIEGSAIADQSAYLIDPGSNRYAVAAPSLRRPFIMIVKSCGRSLGVTDVPR